MSSFPRTPFGSSRLFALYSSSKGKRSLNLALILSSSSSVSGISIFAQC